MNKLSTCTISDGMTDQRVLVDPGSIVKDLPQAQKKNSPWRRTKISPCPVLTRCCSCKEFKPIDEFYLLADKKSARRDILGDRRNSQCRYCANQSYVKTPQPVKMLRAARQHAKEKGVPCTLTVNDIVIPQNCPVLGIQLKASVGQGRPNCRNLGPSPSIDRVVNELGYIPGNICIISTRANHLKSNGTLEEFRGVLRYMEECESGQYETSEFYEDPNKIEITKRLFTAAKRRARVKGLEFSLTLDDIKIPKYCPALGFELTPVYQSRKENSFKSSERSPSIDRIDNSKGYTPDNIRVISARANHLKSNGTLEEIRAVYQYMNSRRTGY